MRTRRVPRYTCGFTYIHTTSVKVLDSEFDDRCFMYTTGVGRPFVGSCTPAMIHSAHVEKSTLIQNQIHSSTQEGEWAEVESSQSLAGGLNSIHTVGLEIEAFWSLAQLRALVRYMCEL